MDLGQRRQLETYALTGYHVRVLPYLPGGLHQKGAISERVLRLWTEGKRLDSPEESSKQNLWCSLDGIKFLKNHGHDLLFTTADWTSIPESFDIIGQIQRLQMNLRFLS